MRPFICPILMLTTLAACTDSPSPPRGRGGGLGKADGLTGSCQGSDCNGPAEDGSCYCDDACLGYGGCCADRAPVCTPGPELSFELEPIASQGDIGNRLVTSDEEVIAGTGSGIALDAAGAPHIVYRSRAGLGTSVSHREQLPDGSWRREAVELGGAGVAESTGTDLSIVVAGRTVHVVALRQLFTDEPVVARTEVRHAWRDEAGWHSELVAAIEGVGAHAAHVSEVVIDASGALHVAYTSPPEGSLLHAVRSPSGWTSVVVAPFERSWFGRPRLALGRDGSVHIAYTPTIGGITRLVHASGRGGPFTTEVVAADAGEVSVSSVSIAVGPDGTAHMAFQADGRLHHARGTGDWRVVDDRRDTGNETAIAVTGGAIHIAYRDEASDDLRYARAPLD